MAKSFNPGNYKHKIHFLQRGNGFYPSEYTYPSEELYLSEKGQLRSEDYDSYGELKENWNVFKTIYASKNPILGNEFFSALTSDNKVEVKFNMRYTSGITSDMRIKHGNEIYEIIGPPIDVKSMHKELLCYCRLVKE